MLPHWTSGHRLPTWSEPLGIVGLGVGQAQAQRSAKIPLTESPTDKPDWPAPFGAAVRPKAGVSKEPTGERITYSLWALGRWEGGSSVKTDEVRAASASG